MSPPRISYRAPGDVCRFFELFRASLAASLSPELRVLHRSNQAEVRGGGKSHYKRHHHLSRFDDIKAGFEYILWPDHLGHGDDEAGLGLYATGTMFGKKVHRILGPMLRKGALRDRIIGLGFKVTKDQPQPSRDQTTGTWLAKRVITIDWTDGELAEDAGRRLGGLMTSCHPVVREVVERDFPTLLKGRVARARQP